MHSQAVPSSSASNRIGFTQPRWISPTALAAKYPRGLDTPARKGSGGSAPVGTERRQRKFSSWQGRVVAAPSTHQFALALTLALPPTVADKTLVIFNPRLSRLGQIIFGPRLDYS